MFLQCKTLYSVSPILLQLEHTMKQAQGQTLYVVTSRLQLVSLFTGMWELYIVNLRVRGEGALQAKCPNGQSLSWFPQHEACLGVLLFSPGWDASPLQGLYNWVKWSKVSSAIKETTRRVRLESWTSRSRVRGVKHSATHASIFLSI